MKRMILLAGSTVLTMIIASGCQQANQTNATSDLKDDRVATDPAIDARGKNWQVATTEYVSGDVLAGPTLFECQPDRTRPQYQQALLEPVVYLGQAVASPVMALITPAWGQARYQGAVLPVTYVAMPPLLPTDPAVQQQLTEQHQAAIERQNELNEKLKEQTAAQAQRVEPPVKQTLRPLPDQTTILDQPAAQPAPQPQAEPVTPRVVEPSEPAQSNETAPPVESATPDHQPTPSADEPAPLNK